MNSEELLNQIEKLKKENESLKNNLIETQEHLKKYTSPLNMKKYYENHKEELKVYLFVLCLFVLCLFVLCLFLLFTFCC